MKIIDILFKKIDDMDDIEIDFVYPIFEKFTAITCFLGYHTIVDDDGDKFCLFCEKWEKVNKKVIKDNIITAYIKNRTYELRDVYHDLHDPYANY